MVREYTNKLLDYCENYGVDVWEETLKSLLDYINEDQVKQFVQDELPLIDEIDE